MMEKTTAATAKPIALLTAKRQEKMGSIPEP